MKRTILSTITVICIYFSLIIGVLGAVWCERTGEIWMLAVSAGLMMVAWITDSMGKRCRR